MEDGVGQCDRNFNELAHGILFIITVPYFTLFLEIYLCALNQYYHTIIITIILTIPVIWQ